MFFLNPTKLQFLETHPPSYLVSLKSPRCPLQIPKRVQSVVCMECMEYSGLENALYREHMRVIRRFNQLWHRDGNVWRSARNMNVGQWTLNSEGRTNSSKAVNPPLQEKNIFLLKKNLWMIRSSLLLLYCTVTKHQNPDWIWRITRYRVDMNFKS